MATREMGYKDYELLVASVLRGISKLEGLENSTVKHNLKLPGMAGGEHQIDVFWQFEKGGIEFKMAVQAKDYNKKVDFPTVMTFKGVLDDLQGRPRGLMFTRKGYDKGNIDRIAHMYGISLFTLDDYTGKTKQKQTTNDVALIGEEVTIVLNSAKFSREINGKPRPSENQNFENLHFKYQLTRKRVSVDEIRILVALKALREGITTEPTSMIFKPEEPLLVEIDGEELSVLSLDTIVSVRETSPKKNISFVTHLVKTATGATYEIDNLFNVYKCDN